VTSAGGGDNTRFVSSTESSAGSAALSGVGVRRVWLWAIGVTLLASLPGLFVGFASDDLSQRLMLEGRVPGYTGGWFGLYDFTPPSLPASALIEQGLFPWFSDPTLALRFFRPLSSATLALDHVLFGRQALLAHLHTLLWLVLLVGVAARLYQRWFSAQAALLAALVFALSGVLAIPVSWLASRHTLVAASFGVLALWAWLRFREDGFKPGLALALLALAAGLLASESGLVAIVLLASYELGTHGLRRGARTAALFLGLGLVYVITYAAFGYGARAGGFYVSPFDSPRAYLTAVVLGVPALSAELLLGLPSIAAGIGGRPTQLVFAGLGLAAVAGSFFLLRALARTWAGGTRRVLTWLSLGTLVGLVALVGAPASGRVLPLPLLASAALAGHAISGCWGAARGRFGSRGHGEPAQGWPARRGRKRWWAAFGLVVFLQLGISPLVRLSFPSQFRKTGEQQQEIAREADVGACARGGSLYLVNGSDPNLTLYAAAALLFYTPEKAGAERLRVLSMAPQPQLLTRTAPGVLQLHVLEPPRRKNPFEQLFRGPEHPLLAGQRVQLAELAVQVDEATEGAFTRASFTFPGALDNTRSCLLVWRHGRLENLALPGVGESVRIEHEPGPMGL
jgi:hypothetical protein